MMWLLMWQAPEALTGVSLLRRALPGIEEFIAAWREDELRRVARDCQWFNRLFQNFKSGEKGSQIFLEIQDIQNFHNVHGIFIVFPYIFSTGFGNSGVRSRPFCGNWSSKGWASSWFVDSEQFVIASAETQPTCSWAALDAVWAIRACSCEFWFKRTNIEKTWETTLGYWIFAAIFGWWTGWFFKTHTVLKYSNRKVLREFNNSFGVALRRCKNKVVSMLRWVWNRKFISSLCCKM